MWISFIFTYQGLYFASMHTSFIGLASLDEFCLPGSPGVSSSEANAHLSWEAPASLYILS